MEAFWNRVLKKKKRIEIARSLDLSHQTVNGWVRNDRIPRADDAVKIAKACGTTVEFLVTGEEEPEAMKKYQNDRIFRIFMDRMASLDSRSMHECVGAVEFYLKDKLDQKS